jgi:hypothetical protein
METHCVVRRRGSHIFLFSEFPVVTDVAARGAARFCHLSAVPVVAVVECLDAMQLHVTVLMR